MKLVIIGGSRHITYALKGILENPQLKLCGFAEGIQGDMPENTVETFKGDFKAKAFDEWRRRYGFR
ncbi:MAG: hypothetical protein PHV82_00105 [Victivallaceae bacterium]|nr:hypothetical protein [Victivallaceae bacterium]